MTTRHRAPKGILASGLILAFLGNGLIAPAMARQTAEDAAATAPSEAEAEARLERVQRTLADRAVTRPRRAPATLGETAISVDAPPVDWAEVRRLLETTRIRETQNSNTITSAPTRAIRPAEQGALGPGLRRLPATRLQTIAQPELLRVTFPVLIPATTEIVQNVQVFGQPNAYTAIATPAEGVALRISGTRKRLRLPEQSRTRTRAFRLQTAAAALPNLDAKYVITRSDTSTDLSFSKFGGGYVISLMCDDPQGDLHCAEDDYILSLAELMVLLNEAPEEGVQP